MHVEISPRFSDLGHKLHVDERKSYPHFRRVIEDMRGTYPPHGYNYVENWETTILDAPSSCRKGRKVLATDPTPGKSTL